MKPSKQDFLSNVETALKSAGFNPSKAMEAAGLASEFRGRLASIQQQREWRSRSESDLRARCLKMPGTNSFSYTERMQSALHDLLRSEPQLLEAFLDTGLQFHPQLVEAFVTSKAGRCGAAQ